MFNQKTNEKKKLRKVKKHWLIFSSAIVLATAGGVMLNNDYTAKAATAQVQTSVRVVNAQEFLNAMADSATQVIDVNADIDMTGLDFNQLVIDQSLGAIKNSRLRIEGRPLTINLNHHHLNLGKLQFIVNLVNDNTHFNFNDGMLSGSSASGLFNFDQALDTGLVINLTDVQFNGISVIDNPHAKVESNFTASDSNVDSAVNSNSDAATQSVVSSTSDEVTQSVANSNSDEVTQSVASSASLVDQSSASAELVSSLVPSSSTGETASSANSVANSSNAVNSVTDQPSLNSTTSMSASSTMMTHHYPTQTSVNVSSNSAQRPINHSESSSLVNNSSEGTSEQTLNKQAEPVERENQKSSNNFKGQTKKYLKIKKLKGVKLYKKSNLKQVALKKQQRLSVTKKYRIIKQLKTKKGTVAYQIKLGYLVSSPKQIKLIKE